MDPFIVPHFAVRRVAVDALEAALEHLGAWLDAERDTLAQLLAQAGRWQAAIALDEMAQLHLEPQATAEDLRDLLERARACLEYLFETVCALPRHGRLVTAWGLPGPAAFDAHVRYSGARLEDILRTLTRALDR